MKSLHVAASVFLILASSQTRSQEMSLVEEDCKVDNQIPFSLDFLKPNKLAKQTGLTFDQRCEGEDCYVSAKFHQRQLAVVDFNIKLQHVAICKSSIVTNEEDQNEGCLKKYVLRTSRISIEPPRPDVHYSNVIFYEAIPLEKSKDAACYNVGSADGPALRVFADDFAGESGSHVYAIEEDSFLTQKGALREAHPLYLHRE